MDGALTSNNRVKSERPRLNGIRENASVKFSFWVKSGSKSTVSDKEVQKKKKKRYDRSSVN